MRCKSSLREEKEIMSAKQSPEALKTIADVAFTEGQRLAADPNILAVGHGAKFRDGRPDVVEAVTFFVREKLTSPSAIAKSGTWPIPPRIGGFSTDVIEVGHLSAAAADRTPPAGDRGKRIDDPLVGGVATMSLGPAPAGPGGYGTLGGHCFDSATKAPLVLSNAHVWGTSANTEIVQPVTATEVLGAPVTPAAIGTPPRLVQTRVPTALAPAAAFANSVGQTYLVAGSDADPLPTGQAAAPVAATSRTDTEQVVVSAPAAGLPPAGQRQSPTVSWAYQRLGNTGVLQNTTSAARPTTKLLTARRLFSNAAAYSGSQPINLYAEVIPAAGGAPAVATSHHAIALLYPLVSGEKVIPRVLRPTARQSVTTVNTSFAGFPNPARLGATVLPAVAGAGAFAVDSDLPAAFATPPGGSGLPAGTFVLTMPAGDVRLFVPIGTQVVVDINLTGSPGPLTVSALNSARDTVATTFTTAPGTSGRTLVTISASEIVEVVMSGVANAQLFGITSRRASPEATAPLCYAGALTAADLTPKGKWGASLFVQAVDSGGPESANIVETAIGAATLISDCTFDVA
jgi:hypothetical protein